MATGPAHKNHERKNVEDGYLFAPHEVAFAGHSGAGKTTLICRLIEELRPALRVGYVKHDAHSFQVDREGKDTWRAGQSGAASILISNASHAAWLHDGEIEEPLRAAFFPESDVVLVEGHRRSPLPKVVVLDRSLSILAEVRAGQFGNIVAYVRPHDRSVNVPGDLAPLFEPDDVRGLAAFLRDYLRSRALSVPLCGLVLCGGQSSRMGQDKAAIAYHGVPQARHVARLLSEHCARTFVSADAQRAGDSLFSGLDLIPDSFVGFGPMGGILSAFHAHPRAAWLVVGCDMPFVSGETIRRLLAARDPLKLATAFVRPGDGLPEPMCAVYEPSCRRRLLQFLAEGSYSPKKVLLGSRIATLAPADDGELDNVNDPREYEAALKRLGDGRSRRSS